MIFHPRSDWTKVAAANANPVNRSLLKGVAIHWNGPSVPLSAFTDPRNYLEGVRRFHVSVKGWSDIAYSVAVDQDGDVWDLRGWGYQSGANGSEATNDAYLAILCIVGQGQKASPKMLAGVGAAVAAFRVRYSTARRIVTHHAIRPDPTECPGTYLSREVAAGTFDTTTVPQEDDMQLNDLINIAGTDAGGDATTVEVGVAFRRIYEWAYRADLNSAASLALAKAAAQSPHPLTGGEIEAVVVKAIAEHVVRVDVNVNAPQP